MGRLLRAALAGAALAWIADRILAGRAAGAPPPPVHTSVRIHAPVEAVWDVLADIEGQPRWMRDLKAVRLEDRGTIGVGTRAEGDVRIFGMAALDPVTITAFEPPRRFGIRHDGRFSGTGDIRLDPGPGGDGTIVRWSETLVPPVVPHVASWLLAPVLRRVFQADLDRLRELVETGSVAD
ncbi:MAG: SRPBCC family protein [Chloroflexi bacterium]|nr:SRPBCC family protein [Chloroflexota bacterium]